MMTFKTSFIWMLSAWGCLVSCGTKVETGRNKQPRNRSTAENAPPPTSDDLDRLSKGDCFNTTEAPPEVVTLFCDSLASHQGHYFASLNRLLCEDKKLFNLFRPECGWDGTGNPKRFLRSIEHTDIKDKGNPNFYYKSAYALTLGKTNKSLGALLLLAYTNVTAFREKYIFPANTIVTPFDTGIVKDGDSQVLGYDMDVKGTTGSTRFTSEIRVYALKDKYEVVQERSLVGKVGINMRRNIHISYPLADGRHKIVVLEEYDVPDHGLHDIALQVLTDFDVNRMRLYYDNFKIPN